MIYKRASFGLMKVLTTLLCFITVLLATPWGTQLTFFLVSGSFIQVEYKSGAFLNNLQLSQLSIKNDAVSLNANNIHLQLHLRCFWKNELCIDKLSVASLQVTIKESSSTSADALVDTVVNTVVGTEVGKIITPPFFTLPFSVNVKNISLAKVHIINQNVAIKLTEFSAALSINDSAINIVNATLTTVGITLPEAHTLPVQPTQKSVSPWPLATLPKVSLPFELTVKSFAVKKIIINESATVGDDKRLLSIEDTLTRLSWFNTTLVIDTLSSTIPNRGNVALMGNIDLVSPYRVDLTLLSSIKNSEALPQLNDSTQKVSLHGDLSRLAITANSEGSLALTTEALIDITDPNLPYKLTANITQFTLPSNITNIIKPSMFSLKSQGDLNQQKVDLKSEFSGLGYHNVTFELEANVSKNTLQINALHLQDPDAENVLNMSGELNFGNELSWNINLDSLGVTLPPIDPRVSGRVQGNIQSKGFWYDDKWAFSLIDSAIKGEVNNIPLNAAATIDINHKGALAPSKVVLNYGDIAIKLKGHSDQQWHVDGTANIGNTSSWLKDIKSNLSAKIGISGPIQAPNISLQGELKKLLIANFDSDTIDFEAQYRPMNDHKYQLTFTSLLMNLNDHTINSMNFTSQGDLKKQQVNLAWAGDSSLNLLIDSHYSPVNGQWAVQTKKAIFSLGEQIFQPNHDIHLLYKETQKTASINEHCWRGDASQLCLTENTVLKLAKGTLPLSITLDTQLLAPFIPKNMLVKSTIDGSISIGWQQDNMPSVDAKLSLSAGHIKMTKEGENHALFQWNKGLFNVQIQNNNLAANIALSSVNNTEVLKASTSIALAEDRIMNSTIAINGFNLSPLHVFVPELSLLEGILTTDLTLTGNLDKPIIKGKVHLTKGKTKVLGDMNTLEDIHMLFDFKGQQAAMSGGLNINTVAADLTGNIDWQKELYGNVNFDGESLNFSLPPDLTLTVSSHLNAQIKASELKLSGNIEVLKGKLSVDKLPQGSVSLSKDVIIVNDEGKQIKNEKPFNVLTNVHVVIADAFQVEGQGFVGRIGGELQVSQQAYQPLQLFGSLKVSEGRYRAYGQDLSITKGNISFNGPVNNPHVSMQATRSIEKQDIIVGIDATGLANSLQIKLFSKPTMQQSETLSYLVRGKGLDAKTNGGNIAIAVALSSAVTNYSGILSQIERLPLINRLEVDGNDQQASIAGYLGEQVYIKYGIGVVEPINELTVRFYLLSRLWIEAVSSLESSANIYYSFDIN
jgi:translocation and assembly module TamB